MKEVRWKPEEGERYYFIDPLGNVNWYLWNSMTDSLYYKVGNCFRTAEEAQHVSVLFKKLLQETILRDEYVIEDCNQPETNCNQLPRLTTEVFDRPDCPEWANYAAVDKCGSVRLFSDSPWLGESCWNWSNGEVKYLFGETFDASDWQKSRIKRPKKNTLPDWCKVGEWVWTDGAYHKIIEVGKDWFRTSWGDNTGLWGTNILHQFKQARLRPYNAEEMKALMGKVIEWDEYLELVTKYNKNVAKVYVDNWWADAKFLMNNGYTIDGAPCGKLEHLEDGEWTR